MSQTKAERIRDFLELHKDGYGESDLRATGDRALMQELLEERKNLLHWIDFKEKKVLLIGSEDEAAARELASQGALLEVVDALPQQEEEATGYDWIVLCGGLMNDVVRTLAKKCYGKDGAADASLTALLKELCGYLAEGGRILLSTDNRMGLKYMSTTRQEEIPFGEFSGRFGEAGQSRFTKKELQQVFADAGLSYCFYYPFPDTLMPEFIFSDAHLPDGEDFLNNAMAWNEGVRLFEEHGAYNTLLEEGLFTTFTSGYLCILAPGELQTADLATYVKYSSRRNPEYAISTELYESAEGTRQVKKRAFLPEGEAHVQRMIELQKGIAGALSNTKFSPCMAHGTGDPATLSFDFVRGESYERRLDVCVFSGDTQKAYDLMKKFFDELSRGATREFVPTEEFAEVFLGDMAWPEMVDVTLSVTDVDLIFANVICEQEKWWIIDYEWTFAFPIPFRFLLYRVLFYYLYANPKRREMLGEEPFTYFGFTAEERELYGKMEEHFQQYILGDHHSLYREDGFGNVLPTTGGESVFAIEVYEDFGEGFAPESLRRVKSTWQDGKVRLVIPVTKGCMRLRMDPAAVPGLLHVDAITDENGGALEFLCNETKAMKGDYYLFAQCDPNVVVYLPPQVTEVIFIYTYDGMMPTDDEVGSVLPAGEEGLQALFGRITAMAGVKEASKGAKLSRRMKERKLMKRIRSMHRKAR